MNSDSQSTVALLSNGRYSSLVTRYGTGYSTFHGLDLTRWRDDVFENNISVCVLLRDMHLGNSWSATPLPLPVEVDNDSFAVRNDVLSLKQTHKAIETCLDIFMSQDDDVELRSLAIHNQGGETRHIEITSYLEVVLNAHAADVAHPAFSKLFVQTGFESSREMLTAMRRPRSPIEATPWMAHSMIVSGGHTGELQYETDRMRFLGRGRSLCNALAMTSDQPLSDSVGNVLDPIFSLRRVIEIHPLETIHLTFIQAAAYTQDHVQALIQKYRDFSQIDSTRRNALSNTRSTEVSDSALPDYILQKPGIYNRACTDSEYSGNLETQSLAFFNGYGGFCQQSGEYIIQVSTDLKGNHIRPPLPWTNVIANENAGFIISESGGGNTWSGNSREHRITPWKNDPVTDPVSEAVYIRDEQSRIFWSPMPAPAPDSGCYEVRHAFGHTRFIHISQGIRQQTTHFVPRQDAVHLIRLQLTNLSGVSRRLSVYLYAQLLLGEDVERDTASVITDYDEQSGAILAHNSASKSFAGEIAFAAAHCPDNAKRSSFTTCRRRFIGNDQNLSSPHALMHDPELDNDPDCESSPCAALQLSIELPASDKPVNCILMLGTVSKRNQVSKLVSHYYNPVHVDDALRDVVKFWSDSNSTLQVETPCRAIDLMLNGWLNYQNMSCRLWGRSAFYQSGGAYGYRDQLQDSAALVYNHPEMTRAQILRHAAHQFVEGDVLHWWHPPKDYGIRTRFSDDLLWLPYITAFFMETTGQDDILTETLPFITSRMLNTDEDEALVTPEISDESADLYEHCCRAIDRSLTHGAHGLPLMGSGDWNDGMNRVGREGRGESVWLGFFIYSILESFIPICSDRIDSTRAERYTTYKARLEQALNTQGWDGEWYRRAYYDNGDPLGASTNSECRIDAIAQAWAVISNAAPEVRKTQALDALEKHLISSQEGIIRLLTPAFDRTVNDPGYIKGYLPGVRENGGQYTHAAMWVIRAFAEQGRGERATELMEMLSPVTRGGTPDAIETYQTEPYVVAADVYGVEPHIGRGGWTWYTGSAGWMYRVAVESILGFRLEHGKFIRIKPAVPASWKKFQIRYRHPGYKTRYSIEVCITGSGCRVTQAQLDGVAAEIKDGAGKIPLSADGGQHAVLIRLE